VSDDPQTASDLGRRLGQTRRQVEGSCRACGKPFKGAANRRYCSDRCRWRFYRHRWRHELFSLQHHLSAVRQGSASVFIDQDGHYWVQLQCLQGPKEGEPGFPTDPDPTVLDAAYLAWFRPFAEECRSRQER
jgi:hypothetical protein